MKKKVLTLISLLFLAPFVLANNWGIGIKAGITQNNPKGMQDAYDEAYDYGYDSAKLTKNRAVFGVEALYERGSTDKIGVKLGAEMYGQNKLELSNLYGDSFTAKEDTYMFPLTAYYKKDNGIGRLSWFAGAGFTLINTKMKEKEKDYYDDYKQTYSTSKLFPHLTAGAEYRFTQVFALGIEAKWNINAKVKKYGWVISDHSGLGAAVTGRFYF